jgi:hypothetical protein
VGAPYLLEIEFFLTPEKRREFLQSRELFLGADSQANNRVQLLQDRKEPDHLLYVAKWIDLEELERYTEAQQFHTLMGGLRLLSKRLDCRIVTLSVTDA